MRISNPQVSRVRALGTSRGSTQKGAPLTLGAGSRSPASTQRRATQANTRAAVDQVLGWYFEVVYGTREGPGVVPFYCDPTLVGGFAVQPSELADGSDAALFRLFVAMSMFQAQRDVVIMRRQGSMTRSAVRVLTDESLVGRAIRRHRCSALSSADAFEHECDVVKHGDAVDCGRHPEVRCHVKDATVAFNRMGDMGKLPTSAWLLFWQGGGVHRVLDEVRREEASPGKRAVALVRRFERVQRVGRKLATMFVSALTTPALAPGLTPWFPDIDGNDLVVVDTNVARAVDALRPAGAVATYDARERWIRDQAVQVDLRAFHPKVPSYSPRLLQQALYAFCSKSNRSAAGDACAVRAARCATCIPPVCPFAR